MARKKNDFPQWGDEYSAYRLLLMIGAEVPADMTRKFAARPDPRNFEGIDRGFSELEDFSLIPTDAIARQTGKDQENQILSVLDYYEVLAETPAQRQQVFLARRVTRGEKIHSRMYRDFREVLEVETWVAELIAENVAFYGPCESAPGRRFAAKIREKDPVEAFSRLEITYSDGSKVTEI